MMLSEVGELFYGFYLHFNTNSNFDFTKKNYKLGYTNYTLKHYTKINQRVFEQCMRFGKNSIVMFAIMNQLKLRNGNKQILDFDDDDLREFMHTLQFSTNDFKTDIDWLYSNVTNIQEVYEAHINKKLKWYTLYYVLKYVGNNNKFIMNNVSIQMELSHIHKGIAIFNFDTKVFIEYVKKLELRLEDV